MISKLKGYWLAGPGPATRVECFTIYLKGLLMGIADVIPGVSGGTIAFITGIYDDLLEGIHSVDLRVIKNILTFKWEEAFKTVHLRFLLPLALGIVTAIFLFSHLMHYLLTQHPVYTWSLFFGLITSSTLIIWKSIAEKLSFLTFLTMGLGAVVSYLVIGLIPVSTPTDLWFVYICGMIGIMAMILPGLSGSFLLLILGKYEYITAAVKNPVTTENISILLVFTAGTATGLVGFSNFLRFLLKKYRRVTLSVLTGVLIGSLRKIWPWKEVLLTKVVRGKVKVLSEVNVLPSTISGEEIFAFLLILIGFALGVVMEYHIGKKNNL
jgi:putative membrane protein